MAPPHKLILQCSLAPGDIVMLTAAVRDLHAHYPGRFFTDVRTPCPEFWENNPYLTTLQESDPGVRILRCHYPLINRSNQAPYHCLHGFIEYLNDRLGLAIKPTLFQGDIHLSEREKSWYSQIHELTGEDTPFWIVAAGGKYDMTVKWWDVARYQKVVDHFRDRIVFVQVGDEDHFHPALNGVIDLRGQTDLRQLVRLIYHAQGVLCPVTCLMHLASAVEVKGDRPRQRPCVVVAGGREPVHWEAYPHHQFIHTVGALPCCDDGGCWRSRTLPLGDGDKRDASHRLCRDVVGELPRCMDMITAEEVIRRVETYYTGGVVNYLTRSQARRAWKAVAYSRPRLQSDASLDEYNARPSMELFLRQAPPYPGGFRGRGIVICAGGVRLFTNAWVAVRRLRALGCRLPVELWFLGERELDREMAALMRPLGVRCVDALEVRRRHPMRILGGWELKPYAMLHSSFREVLLLDADNVPLVDPALLFDAVPYRETGAIFWPDIASWDRQHPIWRFCGIPYREEPQFESGQMVVDKRRCWRALQLTVWINGHSDFFYRHIHGDKDTFRLAWRKCGQAWSMPRRGVRVLDSTFCQHDFSGRRIFQHRGLDKWDFFLRNKRIPGFRSEAVCFEHVRELQRLWDGRLGWLRSQYGSRSSRSSASSPSARRRATMAPVRLEAVMISCPRRARLRRQTLRELAATDWGGAPVKLRIDEGLDPDPQISQCCNAYRILRESLKGRAEYLLFLEDDLKFNRFIRHNLSVWEPLRNREITLASLYNPGVAPLACDLNRRAIAAEPVAIRGSLALLLSRETVRYLVRHWDEEEGGQDVRMARLAGRLGRPLWLHVPSLVQHTGIRSTWDVVFYQAKDFDPEWKATARGDS